MNLNNEKKNDSTLDKIKIDYMSQWYIIALRKESV